MKSEKPNRINTAPQQLQQKNQPVRTKARFAPQDHQSTRQNPLTLSDGQNEMLGQVSSPKHAQYFSNKLPAAAEINLSDSADIKHHNFYQNYLDVDIEDNAGVLPPANCLNCSNQEKEQVFASEVYESNLQCQSRKPKTATGIFGREGVSSAQTVQQSATPSLKPDIQTNNYISQKGKPFLSVQSPKMLHNKNQLSLQTPQSQLQTLGYKSPNPHLATITLPQTVKHSARGNHQNLLAPIIELDMQLQAPGAYTDSHFSRNEELKTNKSQQKSQQAVARSVPTHLDQPQPKHQSHFSKTSLHFQSKQAKQPLKPQLDLINPIESPLGIQRNTNATVMSPRQNKTCKKSKKGTGKVNQKNRQLITRSSMSNRPPTIAKNFQSVPQSMSQLGSYHNQANGKEAMKDTQNPKIMKQLEDTQPKSGQARSVQGFITSSKLFESKYNTTAGAGLTSNLEQDMSCLLAQPQKQGRQSTYVQKEPEWSASKKSAKNLYSSAAKQKPKTNFAQEISTTQMQPSNLQDKKTTDNLMQNLNEKAQEVLQLKTDKNNFQNEFQQTKQELTWSQNVSSPSQSNLKFTPSAAKDYLAQQNSASISQRKHSKTLSLQNNLNVRDLKSRHLDKLGPSPLPDKTIQSTTNKRATVLEGIEQSCGSSETPRRQVVLQQKCLSKGPSNQLTNWDLQNHQRMSLAAPSDNETEKQMFLSKVQDRSKGKHLLSQKKKSLEILTDRSSGLREQIQQKYNRALSPGVSPLDKQAKLQFQMTWTNNQLQKSTNETQYPSSQINQENETSKELATLQNRMVKVLQGYKQREQALIARVQNLEHMLLAKSYE